MHPKDTSTKDDTPGSLKTSVNTVGLGESEVLALMHQNDQPNENRLDETSLNSLTN